MIGAVNSTNFVRVMLKIPIYSFFFRINANLIKFNDNAETYQTPVMQLRWKILQKVSAF